MAIQFNHPLQNHSNHPNMHTSSSSDTDSQGAADDAASVMSDDSDTSSEITQLDQADFPAYFREWSGRLFHSHGMYQDGRPCSRVYIQVHHMRRKTHAVTCLPSSLRAHPSLIRTQENVLKQVVCG